MIVRIGVVAFMMGTMWFVCEYGSATIGVVVLAGIIGAIEVSIKDRLDRITQALEMHSKKVFPELWE
jgi:hypothetical protein